MDGGLIVAIFLAIIIIVVAYNILKGLFEVAIRALKFIGALLVAVIPGLIIFAISDAALATTIQSAGVGATASVALAVAAHSTLG